MSEPSGRGAVQFGVQITILNALHHLGAPKLYVRRGLHFRPGLVCVRCRLPLPLRPAWPGFGKHSPPSAARPVDAPPIWGGKLLLTEDTNEISHGVQMPFPLFCFFGEYSTSFQMPGLARDGEQFEGGKHKPLEHSIYLTLPFKEGCTHGGGVGTLQRSELDGGGRFWLVWLGYSTTQRRSEGAGAQSILKRWGVTTRDCVRELPSQEHPPPTPPPHLTGSFPWTLSGGDSLSLTAFIFLHVLISQIIS